ncbi:MAG: hypothetical protein J6X39_07615 [Bacteroidales bacterium]|nr:hypothetical protein [Bacteroidales bacterium]
MSEQITAPKAQEKNGMGIAGFVLAMVALFSSWVPFARWIVWLLGLIFSLIGLGKQPKGFAVAGLIISLIGLALIVMIIVLGVAVLGVLGGLFAS